jgi:hypothetical protein
VQAPALLLIFFGVVQLCTRLAVRTSVAAIIAAAAVLSRPLFSQTILTKDDLFVTGFFVAAVASLAPERLRDRLGPWRIGVALGLMLATKYTALMSLPILLLAADASFRAGWRGKDRALGAALVVLLAGPWFLRNIWLTGNPIYPIDTLLFDGLFNTIRSQRLGTLAGVRAALAEGYFSLPLLQWAALGLAWLGSIIFQSPRITSEPVVRLTVLGPLLGIGLFLLASPYDEIRFIYPSLVLLFACVALAVRSAPLVAQIIVAAILLQMSLATNFRLERLKEILPSVAIALLILAIMVIGWRLVTQPKARKAGLAIVGVFLACWIFINWTAYVRAQRDVSTLFWADEQRSPYAPLGQAWEFVRTELPPDAKLAYANTFYVYPLYGYDLNRPVMYAPVRARVKHIHDLLKIAEPLSGERIVPAVVRHTALNADKRVWMQNLRSAGVKYLLVGKQDLTDADRPAQPIELTFAEQDRAQFRPLFDNPAAAVYEILP